MSRLLWRSEDPFLSLPGGMDELPFDLMEEVERDVVAGEELEERRSQLAAEHAYASADNEPDMTPRAAEVHGADGLVAADRMFNQLRVDDVNYYGEEVEEVEVREECAAVTKDEVKPLQNRKKRKEVGEKRIRRDAKKNRSAVKKSKEKKKGVMAQRRQDRDTARRVFDRLLDTVSQAGLAPDPVPSFRQKDYPPELQDRTHSNRSNKRKTAESDEERDLRRKEANRGSTRRREARLKHDAQQCEEEIHFLKKEIGKFRQLLNRQSCRTVTHVFQSIDALLLLS